MTSFSSWDDYFYPGTEVLKNTPGITDAAKLAEFEFGAAAFELSNMLTREPVEGNFDRSHMKAIHRRIFGRVYEWAGQERVAPANRQMSKGGPRPESIAAGNYTSHDGYPYYYYPANDDMAPHFDRQVRALHSYGDMSSESSRSFAEKIAEPWGEINVAHIFREGNTRTQVAFFTKFARHHSHDLDFDRFTTDPDFRAKFNAGRFLIQALIGDELFKEVLVEALEGSSDAAANPVVPRESLTSDDYQPNRADIPYDPKYIQGTNPKRYGFHSSICGAETSKKTRCRNSPNCFHHRGGRAQQS